MDTKYPQRYFTQVQNTQVKEYIISEPETTKHLCEFSWFFFLVFMKIS